MIRIAINGFGQVGRGIFRQLLNDENCDIIAINDATSPSMLSSLLNYDAMKNKSPKISIIADDDARTLTVNDKTIKITNIYRRIDTSWAELNIDLVIECANIYGTNEILQQHIMAGAKHAIKAAANTDIIHYIKSLQKKENFE